MGMVFRATHLNLRRTVALKVVRDLPTRDGDFVQRFFREMAAIGRLDHPHVVRATDAGEESGVLFLVMEYVEGINLHRLVERLGPLAVPDACEMIRQAALGLEYIRDRQLVHRDIKPSNLMLSAAGQVKILDLGLARLRDEPDGELTPSNCTLGTTDFLAPEQATNPRRADIRADIYSLGCSLYMLLTGEPPYTGKQYQTPAQKILAHCQTPFPAPSRKRPVPPELLAILTRMTAKRPADRYATPQQVAEALQPWTSQSDLTSLLTAAPGLPPDRPSPVANSITTASAVSRDTANEPATSIMANAPRRRSPRLWWLALLLPILLLGSYLAIINYREPGKEKPLKLGLVPGPPGVAFSPQPPCVPGVPRALDLCKPLKWCNLLECDPVEEIFDRGSGLADWKRDPDSKVLNVHAKSNGLLTLGTVSQPGFTWQIRMEQLPWTGSVGIFWGYRTWAISEEEKAAGKLFGMFQALTVSNLSEKEFRIGRCRGELMYQGERIIVAGPGELKGQNVGNLGGEQILEIVVERFHLRQVSLNGRKLGDLTTPQVNRYFTNADYQGKLGTLNQASSCFYHNANFMLHQKTEK